MQEILFELYHNNIRSSEGTYPKGEEYQKAINKVCDLENALLSQLDESGKELYKQLTLATSARDSIENAYIFTDTFRLGANIMLACLLRGDEK